MQLDVIHTGDCLTYLAAMPEASVDLCFADPPFNIGYAYDTFKDDTPRPQYLEWTESWLKAVKRVLKPDGSLFVAMGDECAAEVKLLIDAQGLTMRNWIVWHYTFGVACRKKFSRSHAHVFYHVMNPKDFHFDAVAVKVPSARQSYGDKRAAPGGKLPDDTWVFPRVCGTFKERTDHPCQMPEALLERIIKAASAPGDLVLDPFAGSGTTLVAAKKLGRRYVGCELSENYAAAARLRLEGVPLPA